MNATTTADLSQTLNNLIETCIDGQKGFATAADALENPQLKAELLSFSQQRREFADDLQGVLASSGESPATTGSIAGTVHRGWINLRDAVTTRETYAILSECERGEDHAVSAYQTAGEAGLPRAADQIIKQQFASIQAAHDRVRSLRNAAKPV